VGWKSGVPTDRSSSVGWKSPIPRHLLRSGNWFQRAQQHAASSALGLASDIRAKVSPVDCIDIRMTCGTKENGVPRRGAAMGVGGRVGRIVVRTQVGLGLHDPSGQQPECRNVRQQLAQQARGHQLRRRRKEGARQQGAPSSERLLLEGWDGRVPQVSSAAADETWDSPYLCAFFHSLSRASTSSAWPSGVTLGKMCSRVWSGPITNVVRSMPITFFPYIFFSFSTPN